MSSGSIDRRHARRHQTTEEHGITYARVRPGKRVTIINISSGGALVETSHRLLPNATVELHLEGSDRPISVRGRVLRCFVARVRSLGVSYRGAIVFDRPLASLADEWSDGNSVHMPDSQSGHHRRADATRSAV